MAIGSTYNPAYAMRERMAARNPLMLSPAERQARAQERYETEDRRRFDAAEARFREAERNRHAEQGFQNETARMTARGEFINRRKEDENKYSTDLGNRVGARLAEDNRHAEAMYDAETRRGALQPPPAPEVPKAPEIVDLGNGRRGYWNGREWVELSGPGAASPAGGPPPPPGRDSAGTSHFTP